MRVRGFIISSKFRTAWSGFVARAARTNELVMIFLPSALKGRERELTEREPDPNKRTNKRNAEAGKRRKEKGQEGGKAERRKVKRTISAVWPCEGQEGLD